MTDSHTIDQRLHAVLADVLGLSPGRVRELAPETGLFGAMPELDSMAVAGLLTEIEDQFHIIIDDDEVNGDMLGTVGSLTQYIASKLKR